VHVEKPLRFQCGLHGSDTLRDRPVELLDLAGANGKTYCVGQRQRCGRINWGVQGERPVDWRPILKQENTASGLGVARGPRTTRPRPATSVARNAGGGPGQAIPAVLGRHAGRANNELGHRLAAPTAEAEAT
jgi:hypothetical protein